MAAYSKPEWPPLFVAACRHQYFWTFSLGATPILLASPFSRPLQGLRFFCVARKYICQTDNMNLRYYPAHAVSERQSFQKNRPHPPELAVGINTSTTFHEPARCRACGVFFAIGPETDVFSSGHPLAGWCQERMLCLGGASRHCFSFFSDASRVIAPVSSNLAANESRQTPIWLKQLTVACPRPGRFTAPEERWCRFASNVSSHFKWLPVF
jgi:hypothetical protein